MMALLKYLKIVFSDLSFLYIYHVIVLCARSVISVD